MSNPWAKSFDEMRAPYLQEKKAKKDYDGDGKVESGSKEHAGSVHNAIQKAKGGKADGKDTRKEEYGCSSDSPIKVTKKKKKEAKEEVVTEKISASGYARAKKWREAQAAQKDRESNAKWEEKARTHKWDGKTWNKRDKPTHDEGQGPHAKKLAAHNAKNESLEVNHIDGSRTQIIDVIRAPKMPSAAPLDEIDGSKLGIGLATGVAAGGAALIKSTIDAAGRLKKNIQKRTGAKEQFSNWREDFIWEGPATAKDPKLDVKETGVKNKIEVNPEVKTEEKKKLTNTAPLSDRVRNWSKTKREEVELDEKKGLWDNIHAKRRRGEPPAKKGEKGYPKTLNVEAKEKGLDGKACWDGYTLKGTKKKGGKTVDNCVKSEDYHSGQGEKKQKRTLKWMKNRGQEGAPGLDAYKERQKEHEKNRGKKKVSEGSAYGLWKGDGKRKLPGDKKKKVDEAKVDEKTPDYKRATVRDKRYGNPHGSHELGGGIRKDRRADHEERRGKKTKMKEGVKYYSGDDRDEKTGYPKGLKSSGGSKKEKDSMTADQRRQMKVEATSYQPRFSVFDEAADRKMGRATDQQLADAHKKFSGMDQSSPANSHMTKRITREMNRRKKAAKGQQGTSPVKEEVGVSSSASITKAKQEAELQRKEALAKKKKGVKEHHQKDSNGKVIEHGDGTPSSVEENVVKKVFDKAKEVWNRPIMAPTITKDQHLKKIRKSGGDTSHWEETEVVSELNRYEKETGKSSGSMNMPKGKKTKKGGDSSQVMRSVRTSIRRETGKPAGQTKTRKKGEKTADMKGPSAKLQKSINNLKSKRELDAKAKKAGYKSTQDYVNVKARYPD